MLGPIGNLFVFRGGSQCQKGGVANGLFGGWALFRGHQLEDPPSLGFVVEFVRAAPDPDAGDPGNGIVLADPRQFLEGRLGLVDLGGAGGDLGRIIIGQRQRAVKQIDRRRAKQQKYNEENGITPISISKIILDISEEMTAKSVGEAKGNYKVNGQLPRNELMQVVHEMEKQMKEAAKNLEFEKAAAQDKPLTAGEARLRPRKPAWASF